MMARCSQGVPKVYPRCTQALGRLMSMPRVWLEAAWSMARVWLEYAYSMLMTTFLRPFSCKRAELERRLAANEITARPSRDYGSSLTRLRLTISLLLMLTLGSVSVWGQTHPYAGVWFMKVKKNLNYYMVPAAEPQVTTANHVNEDAYFSSNYSTQAGDPEKPFVTTYHTSGDLNSIWIFVPVSDEDNYYYIVHAKTGKYIKYQTYLTGDNARRKYVHLETMATPGETEKFEITALDEGVKIKPKDNNMYFNVAGDNQNRYNGGTSSPYYSGMVGGMSGTDTNSQFNLIDASTSTHLTPVISDLDEGNNTFTITSPAAAFSTIHYTTDGSTTPDADTGISATSGSPINITETLTVKAVGVFESFVTPVAGPKELVPIKCGKPVITYDKTSNTVAITSETEDANIYYTLDGETPTSSSTPYGGPFNVTDQQTVKAIAKKTGFPDSEIASVKVVLNPTITLSQTEYTFSGSTIEPEVSQVTDGEETINASEYTVSYYNNINVGHEAVVIITDNPGGKYIVYGSANFIINPKAVTITANDASKTYDNTALTENGFTTSSLETGDTHIFTVSMTEGSTITNAGTQPNVIAIVDGTGVTTGTDTAIGNYLVTTVNGTLTVNPKSLGDGNTAAEGITVEMTDDGSLSAVKDGSTTLVENTDYKQETVEEGSDKIITITGIGNYTGIVKGIYASPAFVDPDGGSGSGQAAAVYQAKRDLSCPSGINPYIIRKVNPSIGTAVITKLDYIPEDVPVLLLSDAEASGFVASPKDPSTPEVTAQTKNSNLLKVSSGGETVGAAQIYMFYKGEFVLTKAGTLDEGKFFLYNPNYNAQAQTAGSNSEPAPSCGSLQIVFDDETTGISELNNSKIEEKETDVWYTIDGRRLSVKPSKAGIYIHQGQKEYIKRN